MTQTTVASGDPFGLPKEDKQDVVPPASEVNRFHSKSDRDSSTAAQHHTLGIGHNQAASGDHIHDNNSTRKLGTKQGLVLTGAKGGNVALANLITMLKTFVDFTDSTT